MGVRVWVLSVVLVVACACFTFGVAQIYGPAAWLVGSVLGAVAAYLLLVDDGL